MLNPSAKTHQCSIFFPWGFHERLRMALPAMILSCIGVWPFVAIASDLNHDPVEQLDMVEITAIRIRAQPRNVPIPSPEMSTVVPLPPESLSRAPVAPLSMSQPQAPRLLLDDIAQTRELQTRVRYLETTRPVYPRRAREMGWQGTVLLRVEVNPDGSVGEVEIRRTSGHISLDQAAAKAAKTWRFEPPADGGFAMAAVVDVPVRFDLTEPEQYQ